MTDQRTRLPIKICYPNTVIDQIDSPIPIKPQLAICVSLRTLSDSDQYARTESWLEHALGCPVRILDVYFTDPDPAEVNVICDSLTGETHRPDTSKDWPERVRLALAAADAGWTVEYVPNPTVELCPDCLREGTYVLQEQVRTCTVCGWDERDDEEIQRIMDATSWDRTRAKEWRSKRPPPCAIRWDEPADPECDCCLCALSQNC